MPSPYEPEGPQGLGNPTLAGRHLRVKPHRARASMILLGDANWYLPKWLEWLPRLEPPAAARKPAERVEAPPVPVA